LIQRFEVGLNLSSICQILIKLGSETMAVGSAWPVLYGPSSERDRSNAETYMVVRVSYMGFSERVKSFQKVLDRDKQFVLYY